MLQYSVESDFAPGQSLESDTPDGWRDETIVVGGDDGETVLDLGE